VNRRRSARSRSAASTEFTFVRIAVLCPRGHHGGDVVLDEGRAWLWDGVLAVTAPSGERLDCSMASNRPPGPTDKLRLRCTECDADSKVLWSAVADALTQPANGPNRTLRMP
jgi:hypothetical protein